MVCIAPVKQPASGPASRAPHQMARRVSGGAPHTAAVDQADDEDAAASGIAATHPPMRGRRGCRSQHPVDRVRIRVGRIAPLRITPGRLDRVPRATRLLRHASCIHLNTL
jgi:hypothetical protein